MPTFANSLLPGQNAPDGPFPRRNASWPTGAVRQQIAIGTAPHFASPTLSGNRAYIGTNAGVTAVNGA